MFEVMDTNRDALDRLEAEKNELEDLWKQEKDKLRAAQRVSKASRNMADALSICLMIYMFTYTEKSAGE